MTRQNINQTLNAQKTALKISLKFVPKVRTVNILALVQIMARCHNKIQNYTFYSTAALPRGQWVNSEILSDIFLWCMYRSANLPSNGCVPHNMPCQDYRTYHWCDCVIVSIQYIAWIWPRYSLRGLHIRITWFSSKTKWYGTTFVNCFDNVQVPC